MNKQEDTSDKQYIKDLEVQLECLIETNGYLENELEAYKMKESLKMTMAK